MTILTRLTERLQTVEERTVTVREITGGKNKGDWGIYFDKTRIRVTYSRKELIQYLNFYYELKQSN
tara:strand:+ start:188 stop:385 length:198 start_codon:yes stop_codon:yes gene_type:complete